MPRLRIVHAERNRGKGHAIRLGLSWRAATSSPSRTPISSSIPRSWRCSSRRCSPVKPTWSTGRASSAGTPDAPWLTLVANRTLTSLTNLLFGSAITDMETCYKVMRTSVARSLGLTADRFDIEPEITARLLKAGHTIVERPVTFQPRSRAAGKKIGWRDGVAAVRVLFRHRFSRRTD